MLGRFAGFSSSTLRRVRTLEDEDPASGLSNLADCMLVLACGLMVALVMAWEIELPDVTEATVTDQTQEVEVQDMDGNFQSGGVTYVDVGRVYQDPETGTYYIIEDQD